MDRDQIKTAMDKIAERSKGLLINRFEFDDELYSTTGRFMFYNRNWNVEITFGDSPFARTSLVPWLSNEKASIPVVEWSVIVQEHASDEDELYDLVMATIRGLTKSKK